MIDKTALNTVAAGAANPFTAKAKSVEPSGTDFSSLLTEMLAKTSRTQETSATLSRGLQMNDPSVSIEDSVLAMNKASLQFQMTVQVRNKVVQAYTDIMNMPI
ncbi:MAG: flagellar hook-basal body complex protein FliE [Burkholderiaceae bacterium]|jgi:flagellar hook-basal body complex protein FliE